MQTPRLLLLQYLAIQLARSSASNVICNESNYFFSFQMEWHSKFCTDYCLFTEQICLLNELQASKPPREKRYINNITVFERMYASDASAK